MDSTSAAPVRCVCSQSSAKPPEGEHVSWCPLATSSQLDLGPSSMTRHLSLADDGRLLFSISPADAAILAEELDARADTLELAARSGARLPSYKGGITELGNRVRVLRREAKRLRGAP